MRRALLIGLLTACGPTSPQAPASESSSETSSGGSGPTPTSSLAAASGTSTSSTGSSGAASSSTGSPESQTFIVDPTECQTDCSGFCDPWGQDCPPGEKCTFYSMSGGNTWDSSKCVPIMDDPVGVDEECFVVGEGATGIDNCDADSWCLKGYDICVAFCMGSPEAASCSMTGYQCMIYGDGIHHCSKLCDPLAQDCPQLGDMCIGNPEGFQCEPDASGDEGQAHDPCEFPNSCDPGLHCLDSMAAVECDPAFEGCCEPFCDVTLPNTCPGQDQTCTPYFEAGEAPVGYEQIGVCFLLP